MLSFQVSVAGSSPVARSKYACIAQVVERNVANVQVAGSNPVARTNLNTMVFNENYCFSDEEVPPCDDDPLGYLTGSLGNMVERQYPLGYLFKHLCKLCSTSFSLLRRSC